jgi:5-methylcytosine-specific restriction protein A
MGYDLQKEENFHFISRKAKKFLEKTRKNYVWVFKGQKGEKNKKQFLLAGLFVPDDIRDDENDPKLKHIYSFEGDLFNPPIDVSDQEWFLKLKKQQANFSIGIAEIKDDRIIEILLKIYDYNFQHIEFIREISQSHHLTKEGKRSSVLVNRYERSVRGRTECIEIYGVNCAVCDMNFEAVYGKHLGQNFIHVHHINPLASIKSEYFLNPEKDLRPVCPNCHAMLHRKKDGVFTISELKEILRKQKL